MNIDATYQRDLDRDLPDRSPALAVHDDPSHRRVTSPLQAIRTKHGVAWVRPSDLPTMLGSKVIGRGLDLKAELVRRADRPTRPNAPKQRTTRTAIADPEPPKITHTRPGGISL